MNKKLMLLAAGVLTALAFAALPALASADEFEAHCEGAGVCTGTITGGMVEFKNSSGETFKCTGLTGTASFATTSTTGTASFAFTECREQVTIFKFKCNSPGVGAGEIRVANLVYHVINLEHTPTTAPGIQFTSVNVTYECTGFSKKTMTGGLIGEVENAAGICNTAVNTHSFDFAQVSNGTQKWMQTETTGPKTDLESNNDAGGAYSTTAIVCTWTIHWDHSVKITC